jgi:putative transposase
VWAFGSQFDRTADGHLLKLLHVVAEFTREALAIKCSRISTPTRPLPCSNA